MQPIRDTGGDIPELRAYLIWHVCRSLPFTAVLLLLSTTSVVQAASVLPLTMHSISMALTDVERRSRTADRETEDESESSEIADPAGPTAGDDSRPPDFGEGVFGFLAFLMWHAYRCFPLPESPLKVYVFLVTLAVVVRISFWPFLWKAVRRDMRVLKSGRIAGPLQNTLSFGFEMISLGIFLACHWALERALGLSTSPFLPHLEISPGIAWNLVVVLASLHVSLVVLVVVLAVAGHAKGRWLETDRSQPYRTRSMASLYAGGGMFLTISAKRKSEVSMTLVFLGISCFFVGLFPLLLFTMLVGCFFGTRSAKSMERARCWEWPLAASLPLWWCTLMLVLETKTDWSTMLYVFPAVAWPWALTEAARMVFVYILHKRTFG